MAFAFASPACAEKGKLLERLTPQVMAVVFPAGAERLGPEEGSPPAIAVYKDDKVAAYVFSTLDIIAAPGYSSTPFDVIAGVDLTGHITGAKVVFHNEPYIVHDPQRQRLLDTFLAREAGRPLRGGTNLLPPDFVAGATVSTRAMRAAVSITAGLVLRARAAARPAVAGTAAPAPAADRESFSRMSWNALLDKGGVVRRRVTSGEVAAALASAGAPDAKLEDALGKPEDVYIDFATALFTLPAIGGNLVGMLNFEEYRNKLANGSQGIFVASKGRYNFLGNKFTQDASGGRFDRLRVVQDDHVFEFTQGNYQFINPFAEGIKGMEDAALFALPANAGFDPDKPWRLDILIHTATEPPTTVSFGLDYKVPDVQALTKQDDAPAERRAQPVVADQVAAADGKDSDLLLPLDTEQPVAAWVEAWHDARFNVAILAVLLTVLTLIFIFQDALARHRRAHRLVRNGFLLVVLFWLGWTAGVQLSIVNVMNYLMAPFNHFDIGF
jgi:transcriptional regulator of nitric oxide reductase